MSETIRLPGAPPIYGLRFRTFDPAADYAAMADVLNRAWTADGLEPAFTADGIRAQDAAAGGFDPSAGRFVAEVQHEMIGVATVHATRNAVGERLYFHTFDLLPAWRRQRIGGAVLRYCQYLLRRAAEAHPADGERFLQTYQIYDQQAGAITLLERDGYRPIRYSCQMLRPLVGDVPDVAAVPDGIEIRPLDRVRLRQVWEAVREAFSDAWGYIPWPDSAFVAWSANPMLRPELSRIAWAGDEVAGTVLIFINDADNAAHHRRRAWTETISVRHPWRRRGIARALLASALGAVGEVGMTEAALSVDTENLTGALKLYESMGYRAIRRSRTFRKPLEGPDRMPS